MDLSISIGVIFVHEVDDAMQTTRVFLSLQLDWWDPLLTWDPYMYRYCVVRTWSSVALNPKFIGCLSSQQQVQCYLKDGSA